MDGRQFTRALQRLRMNVSGAARFFNVDRRTLRRYKTGELRIPVPIAMLLAIMLRDGLEPNDVRTLAHFDPVPLDMSPGRPAENDE